MFEGVVAGILNRFLGKYVQDLDTENLNVGIFSGDVNLTDLKLKPEALYELDLPIDVKIGTVGRVNLQIPWSGLYTQPLIVNIEDVLILVGPAISNTNFDPEREKRLMRAAKRKILQDLESTSEVLVGPQNFFENLFTAIVNNIQIYVRNVHIRYEDSISSKDGPLACGFCLQSLSIETTNSKWKPSVTPANASTVYQMMRIESLSLYWNPSATVLDDAETAHITPMQYYNWKHYMITGLDKFSMHHEEFEFLVKPVTCKVKLIVSRSSEARAPRLLLDAVLQDSALQVSRRQYLSVANLATSFRRIALNRKYRHLHPGVPVTKSARKWWKYAYNVVIEQRVRPYSWSAIQKHRDNYHTYMKTYKSTLRSPNDTELKLDLQKCEDSLPIISVVIAREQAKFELLALEPDCIEVVESEFDWWKPTSSGGESEADSPQGSTELCAKTGRSRTFWTHLSSPERKKVYELIGYVEGAPRMDKPKQYIEHKLNLTLANCSVSLMNRNKEVMVVTLTQFLVSLETRPGAKAYKISARAESIVIEGLSAENDLVPILTAERRASTTTTNFLALDFEKNPLNSEADYGISCTIEPMEITYNEHSCTELINFFQTRSMTTEDLVFELNERIHAASGIGKSVLAYAVSRKKTFNINIDVKGPCIILPEHGCMQKSGRLMILDISRLIIKSDLQPSNLALEDATCMELEERLYDRLHAECSSQVLFCEDSDQWREARRHADSDLHLVPKSKMQIVFSNSIKKDYKLLPRYKLNFSITSLKLNLSDRIIGLFLDYVDNFPLPIPNTVPVSFLDSGDYAEDPQDVDLEVEFEMDKINPDPGFKDLIRLRQKIVNAYLRRNRVSESQFDKSGAKLGFLQTDGAFVSSEHSDEDMEVFARNVELPGFDDNVSPSNNINTLLRFLVGEIVINVSRTYERSERPYLMMSVTKLCVDIALMAFGPALQVSVKGVRLSDKFHHSTTGQYLEVICSDPKDDVLNLLYRKVRADCPEFRSHFHSVERALVVDTGAITSRLHAPALREAVDYLLAIYIMISQRSVMNVSRVLVPKSKTLWDYVMNPEADPPVPPGATKFSYSVRASSLTIHVCHLDTSLIEIRLGGLESDCVFRANDRMILKLFLNTIQVDDLSEMTLYPKLMWLEEDKVLEVKYVRHAPRVYSRTDGDIAQQSVKADGALRFYLGRLHVVLLYKILSDLHNFLEPLIPSQVASGTARDVERGALQQALSLRDSRTRLNLVVDIHAPTLLLPQKPSSPNLLILNMGDLLIENFFKELKCHNRDASPTPSPVVDNVLVKLVNITLSRAVMTLAGTLEVQEPILEQVCVRCDIKRIVGYHSVPPTQDALLYDADLLVDNISINLGQKDLATILAVWSDNISEGHYIGNMTVNSPEDTPQVDTSVKKLQAFFAQGDPVRKEAMLRFTLEGLEVKLFTDMDEVLSSPVRDLNHGLARLSAGETTVQLDCYTDSTLELKASLQSLLLEDIRPDSSIVIKRIFQSHGGSTRASGGISVRCPPIVDLSYRQTTADRALDLRVEQTRLNLAAPFLLQLGRTVIDAMPGSRTLSGGVINHGYVGDAPGKSPPPVTKQAESSSGCFSAAPTLNEDIPGLSISVQFRKPEIMFFTDLTKSESHALLLRTELLIDYSHHSNTETLVVSLAGLQIMSRLQSKLKNLPPQLVLHPCDVEFSRTFKNVEEGVKVKLTVSNIDVHLAATTVHTITDIIEEISNELVVPEEKEQFNFLTYNTKGDKSDDDLWAPKKITPSNIINVEDNYNQVKYPTTKPTETFTMNVQNIKILFEIERKVRIPVIIVKMTSDVSVHDWSQQLHGKAAFTVTASYYNEKMDVWEPFLEPVVQDDKTYTPWEMVVNLFQSKAYPLSSRLEVNQRQSESDKSDSAKTDSKSKTKNRKTGFESETSAEEGDTDNEMTFIRNPNAGDKNMNVDIHSSNSLFLSPFGGDESDSENESGLMDKLASAIGHLFTDESSSDEYSNDEDSSGAEQSETEDNTSGDKFVSFPDHVPKCTKQESQQKTVTMKDPVREDSVDSGLETESYLDKTCTYVVIEGRELNITVTPQAATVLLDLMDAFTNKNEAETHFIMSESDLTLINDIGPGSTVHLVTRAETDFAGNDRILAIADYDVDTSRPSTPGCDTSIGGLIEETKHDVDDVENDWECFEGGFSSVAQFATADTASLLQRLTEQRLIVKMQDFQDLTLVCPQRTATKLHVLQPSINDTRYYLVLETSSRYSRRKIIVRSPLQIRNETSYALELYYKKTDLQATGAATLGELTNPFDDKMRIAIIAPDDTYNVPLHVAYHCHLYLLPSNFESYQTATQGLWWSALGSEAGTARDVLCPAKSGDDKNIFAMRILTQEGCQANKVTRAIPNYLIRVLPPLAFYNRLPYAVEISITTLNYRTRIEAGERVYSYIVNLLINHKVTIDINYLELPWTGQFTLSPDITEKNINMSTDGETDCGNKQLGVCVKVERNETWEVFLHAPYWIINKTGLPLQLKGARSDAVYNIYEEPLLWGAGRMGRATRSGGARMRVRAHHSDWSRAFNACVAAPGLVVCAHRERGVSYRLLLTVTLSELCPQLTKIVTLLPYFLIHNETKRHLRFMEENETADLWMDLAPAQCTPFWPQTDSMRMHCKLRDSPLVSQHFPITSNHFTVLRMDKGSAICVEVTGGTERPFTVTFKSYNGGDAPVKIDNLCDDLFLKLHQIDSGQVALLSPSQSMLYTWDDPAKDRKLMWNIYNNKGVGFIADFSQDGYGEEKVSFHSVKHSTLVATNSVTSKLSSTFKRLTPKSPDPGSSSSEDSDHPESQDTPTKATKKIKKDKVIVYWISYMDGYQRVFTLVQDERLAYHYRTKINSEKSNYEIYTALSSASLSVCVQTHAGLKELSYISLSDSLPRWEVNVSHKWKLISPDLANWIEEKYLTEQKKCQLKEYIHIDLEKMQMTKPFFSELRRTYNPGIWMQLRKSDTHTYLHMKIQRLQIDNQLNEAVFQTVLHPAPLPPTIRTNRILKPCIELVMLKQHRPSLNQDVYKYLKVLIQEYCINLDRGFVNYVFNILNHWKIEEKPAVRLRADLALVHMPLKAIAMNSQAALQRNVLFEFVHLSPLTLILSLSSRGYSADEMDSPSKSRFGNRKENRPKLFNSDLLEYLFNSWGSSLCDMKDVKLRMAYLEARDAPLTMTALTELASRHYWTQLVQQFYVLVLGLKILGNPYSVISDFSKGLKHYYDSYTGNVPGQKNEEIAYRLDHGIASLLGHCAGATTGIFVDHAPCTFSHSRCNPSVESEDIPLAVLEASDKHPASAALALSGLLAAPSYDEEVLIRNVTRWAGAHGCQILSAVRAGVERSGGRLIARRRLPRHCRAPEGLRPYSAHSALGLQLLRSIARGHYADTDVYLAHCCVNGCVLLLTTQHMFLVRAGGYRGAWHVEWTLRLDDIVGVPAVRDKRLLINVRQNELMNTFSTDEKLIEFSDESVLNWMQTKVECALILNLEEKPCPPQM